MPFLAIGATDPALPDVVGNSIFLTAFGDNTQAAVGKRYAKKTRRLPDPMHGISHGANATQICRFYNLRAPEATQ